MDDCCHDAHNWALAEQRKARITDLEAQNLALIKANSGLSAMVDDLALQLQTAEMTIRAGRSALAHYVLQTGVARGAGE